MLEYLDDAWKEDTVELNDAQFFATVFTGRGGMDGKRDEIFIFQALKHSERHGWVEQFEPPMFTDDGDSFLTILPQKQHDASYWRHAVAITNVSSGKTRSFALTSGRFVVTEIVSWDQKNSYL